ncbi:MAG: hypothetical protein DHS20C12_27900 [Pseudohongiella sp.]|nr:MAG: hypothetical protein DHS20C12_27900 [Pseudohongiella sp.]
MAEFHLAQINIAKARDEMDTAVMAGFVSRLNEINALADEAPGFVWRLQSEDGDATSLRLFEDPLMVVNMSVWQDIETLKNFVYRSVHLELLKDKQDWFEKLSSAYQVLWWIPAGHLPSIEEALAKLERIQEHGPSEAAFSFAKPFPAPVNS